jgi:UV DNA damage endonuclease
MLRIGYHGLNHTLRKQDIFADRTARQDTILSKSDGIKYLKELTKKNVEDLYKILIWNIKNKILFYRITSGLAPHITNPVFIKRDFRNNPRALAYNLDYLRPYFKKIGDLAKKYKMRLTFHPGQYVSLASSNESIIIRSTRELYYHAYIMDLMDLGPDSVMIVHGGGLYGNKQMAMKTWIKNYNNMPIKIRKRIALENDEKNYSILDVLKIANITGVPIVFDIFHYHLYNQTIHRKRGLGENHDDQHELKLLFPKIINTWGNRTVKMHISEQRKGGLFGAHSDYVKSIPKILLDFPKKYGRNLDLMIEAKANELAIIFLRRKYKTLI